MAEPLPASPAACGAPESPGKPQMAPNSPQIRRRGRDPARTRLRNRRYAALQELLREGDYFSEERMRLRAPALFQHYIGRFRDPKTAPKPPEIQPGHPKIPKNGPKIPKNGPKIPKNGPKIPKNGPKIAGEAAGPLRELLLSALDSPAEDEDAEEDAEDDEDEDEEGQVPDEEERELLRLEFTTRMHQSFLEGLDRDFDYRQVDENPELDDLELLSQELQDRYFDDEEPSEAPQLL